MQSPAGVRPVPVSPAAAEGRPHREGSFIRLREPVKTVGRGDDAIELRRLTPKERARRARARNLLFWTIGLIVIGVTLALLLFTGPL